jgi:HK97 gp10 family phage protein
MQLNATVDSRQLARILSALKKIPGKEGKKIIRKAAREAANQVLLPVARTAAPSDTGKMRRNIKVRAIGRSKNGVGVRIGASEKDFTGDQFYAAFQELGWRVGKRTREILKFQEATRNSVRSVVKRAEIYANNTNDTRKHIPGRKFLQKTAEQKGEQAANVAANKIGDAIIKLAKQ